MAFINEANAPTKFQNFTFQVKTPDGTMFVEILEDGEKKPKGFIIHLGKSGHATSAWATALGNVMSLALDNGATINDLIKELSSITTDNAKTQDAGEVVRSGPEGVCVALFNYRRQKFLELTETLGVGTREYDTRSARLGDRDS